MTSRGQAETEKLRQNLEGQLDRLVQQLVDLEECKDDLDEAEYLETKADTMEQLQELNESLSKMMKGDMTLVDHLSSMQLATQAAISEAFRTPAVIRMFARREPEQLRQRLSERERDVKLGKIDTQAFNQEKGSMHFAEILNALLQLHDKLTAPELSFLQESSVSVVPDFKKFIHVSENPGAGEEALAMAGHEARLVQKI